MKRLLLILLVASAAFAQEDWIKTGTGLGVEKVRLAAADFKQNTTDAKTVDLARTFNEVLFNDLDNSGIFEMVSKSFYPLAVPGTPQEMKLDAWGNPPPNASMVAFGNIALVGDNMAVQGFLYDVKNTQQPFVLGKQYSEAATMEKARQVAHRFANEIIMRLGGGLAGVTESKIYFISNRTGNKEVFVMDYDGAGETAISRLGTISLSPGVTPDGTRVAFSSIGKGGWQVRVYSQEIGRYLTFPAYGGTNLTPKFSPDGSKIAFSSSMRGDPEIFVVDANGTGAPQRLTTFHGPDVAPIWNPKTGSQIAWVSGQSGLPQIFIMDADGTNFRRLTEEGYAVSPSWSPNGQFLVFSWMRKYGPGAPGGQDIYVIDIASGKWVQLTHGEGRNDFPSWSPDGRQVAFQSDRSGREQIWVMLADGTKQRVLTSSGGNFQPFWNAK